MAAFVVISVVNVVVASSVVTVGVEACVATVVLVA